MGIYSEYIDKKLNAAQLHAERKKQLGRISELRKRDVIVLAANIMNTKQPIAINYSDLLPFNDQLSNLKGKEVDVILETPGGSGETVEDMVRLLRTKYESIAVIVPGTAKSAGTIFAMAANDILMEPASSLGPIDAQITWQGKTFSAHALLEGMNKIKAEVTTTGALNRAYVPMLQTLTPGDLQGAQNAYDFARDLVADWLVNYKFKPWHTHSSTGQPVTDEDRRDRANQIAEKLRDQGKWKTHGRSIKIDDLRAMKLWITDYSEQPDLCDAIRRYHTLLNMTFDTNVFKIFETPTSQIMRMQPVQGLPVGALSPQVLQQQARLADHAIAGVPCGKCGNQIKLFAPLVNGAKPAPGTIPFPADDKVRCPTCGNEIDLGDTRRQFETQFGRAILKPAAGGPIA